MTDETLSELESILLEKKEDLIKELGDEWSEKVVEYIQTDDITLPNTEASIADDFIEAVLTYIKKSPLITCEQMADILHVDVSQFSQLFDACKTILTLFFSVNKLRLSIESTSDDIMRVKNAISAIFENSIIRYDPNLSDIYAQFGFSSDEEFDDCIHTISFTAGICITRNYSVSAMTHFISSNLGFCDMISSYFAEKIEMNRHELRMQVLIDKLSRVEAKAGKLVSTE